MELAGPWTLTPLRRYRVGERDYEVEDIHDAPPLPVTLGDWVGALGRSFSGDAAYECFFDLRPAQAGRAALLDLGEVGHACEVSLNGRPAGRCAWAPCVIEATGLLREGENRLRIVVTNTFANALLDEEVRHAWAARTGPGWPGCYDERANVFEQESQPGGLAGPVALVFGRAGHDTRGRRETP